MRTLYASLSATQRGAICFDWNARDAQRGLVRTFISNHWQITRPCVRSTFYTAAQQQIIHDIFRSLLAPEWYPRFMRQLRDDTKGHEWGADQSIGIFGNPAAGRFHFVFCGRHITLRVDCGSDNRLAFGGPLLIAHQATGYFERPRHPGNIFWEQAQAATRLFDALNDSQRAQAVVRYLPPETDLGFHLPRGGLPLDALAAAQRAHLDTMLNVLLEPFREADREQVRRCLREQGGIERCRLTYSLDGRMSAPWWDNWRIEGPAFVWHFRGFPHVHVWIHVASDADVPVNAHRGTFIFPGHDPLR